VSDGKKPPKYKEAGADDDSFMDGHLDLPPQDEDPIIIGNELEPGESEQDAHDFLEDAQRFGKWSKRRKPRVGGSDQGTREP
jgi:hypothetical protein